MGDLSWLIALFGVILVLVIICDIILTVLHVDTDGPVAWSVFQIIWLSCMKVMRSFPSLRRRIISSAGPLMIVATLAIWIAIFIVGFALIYWPYLDYFYFEDEHIAPGFIHALYFSGVTATVLGYGDLVPLTGALQITSFLQSGIGFALLTGIITYLINVVSGVSERNALALRLWAETGSSGDGTAAVLRSLDVEEIGDLRLRLQTLLVTLHTIHQKMHQFPILDLFYRSRDPKYSPEFMIRSATQIAIAVQILSADQKYRRLKIVSEELGKVSTDIMILIAKQHMSNKLQENLKSPEPTEDDLTLLKKTRSSLTGSFPGLNLSESTDNEHVFLLICKLRIFLDEADRFTGWRMDEQNT